MAISKAGASIPGAPVTLVGQGDNQLDAVFLDTAGAVNVAWDIDLAGWNGPVVIS